MTNDEHEHRWRMAPAVDEDAEVPGAAAWDSCHAFGFGYACDCGATMTSSEDRITSQLWDEQPPGGCSRCDELRVGARIHRVFSVIDADGTRHRSEVAFEQSTVHASDVAGGPARRARPDDADRIAAVERSDGDPAARSGDAIARAIADRLAWVIADGEDEPVASLRARMVDGATHIDRVAVLPAWARRRLGQGLIDMLRHQMVERDGVRMLTVTAQSCVPVAPFVSAPRSAICPVEAGRRR